MLTVPRGRPLANATTTRRLCCQTVRSRARTVTEMEAVAVTAVVRILYINK